MFFIHSSSNVFHVGTFNVSIIQDGLRFEFLVRFVNRISEAIFGAVKYLHFYVSRVKILLHNPQPRGPVTGFGSLRVFNVPGTHNVWWALPYPPPVGSCPMKDQQPHTGIAIIVRKINIARIRMNVLYFLSVRNFVLTVFRT